MRPRLTALVLALATAVALTACGGGAKGKSRGKGAAGTNGACREVPVPKPKTVAYRKPGQVLRKGVAASAAVRTSCGTFTIALDTERYPKTANSFAFLAEQRFYDSTLIHRIVPDFVIQGGDPKGDGSGGPGYSVTEPPADSTAYRRGLVAMAKTEAEPPGTSGSQFYVVTAADAGLPPAYAVLGRVTKGLSVVERIGRLGDPASGGAGTPTKTVVIEKVTIESG